MAIFDEIYKGLGDAITDIRQKVVEEPWWGRSLGENDAPSWPQAQEPEPSFGSLTHSIDVGPSHGQMQENANYRLAAIDRDLNGPQDDRDIDR